MTHLAVLDRVRGWRPAATLRSAPGGVARAMARPAIVQAPQAISIYGEEQSALWQRGNYLRHRWPAGADDHWLIKHFAAARGRGLAQALLAHAMAEGHESGFSRA